MERSTQYEAVFTKTGGKTWGSRVTHRGPNGQDIQAFTHATEEAAAKARDKCEHHCHP